jgi:hypothetical protein
MSMSSRRQLLLCCFHLVQLVLPSNLPVFQTNERAIEYPHYNLIANSERMLAQFVSRDGEYDPSFVNDIPPEVVRQVTISHLPFSHGSVIPLSDKAHLSKYTLGISLQ